MASDEPQWVIKDATVRHIEDKDIDYVQSRNDSVVILMGPTGAGKSRFIEELCGNNSLQISKDQLESVTQKIETYEIVIAEMWQGPGTATRVHNHDARQPGDQRAYVLDTPGFSDSQISEAEIIDMINIWMQTHKCSKVDRVLYFWPITDTRLPGRKRRTIKTLELLTRINGDYPGDLLVVTTMWNRLWNERTKRAAEERFAHLRDGVWKDLLDEQGRFRMTRFMGTHESSIAIWCFQWSGHGKRAAFTTRDVVDHGARNEDVVLNLYQDLLERIENIHHQQQCIERDLAEPETQSNEELNSTLQDQLRRTGQLLTKFETQLIDLGEPPVGLEEAAALRQALIDKRGKQTPQVFTVASSSTDPHLPHHQVTQTGGDAPGKSRIKKIKNLFGKGIQGVKSSLNK
ncbi:hypothetical protein BJ165DRAFT_1486794 [Panaeolus papilionaceus]|nr:hypothetical protein BJ165DRAFT_1486794 [Panaeolus papilionaceus]